MPKQNGNGNNNFALLVFRFERKRKYNPRSIHLGSPESSCQLVLVHNHKLSRWSHGFVCICARCICACGNNHVMRQAILLFPSWPNQLRMHHQMEIGRKFSDRTKSREKFKTKKKARRRMKMEILIVTGMHAETAQDQVHFHKICMQSHRTLVVAEHRVE